MIVTIEDISWERVFLRVTYRADKPAHLKLFRVRSRQFVEFRETLEGDLVTAVVNITQGGGREPCPTASGSSASSCPMSKPASRGRVPTPPIL